VKGKVRALARWEGVKRLSRSKAERIVSKNGAQRQSGIEGRQKDVVWRDKRAGGSGV
jgi:hypothetical protein